ncbi:transposase [Reticulibacter mediterranei]|uniref:Transposase n=1 Tax=Reticulibacter mediterranei TaxID=2778369 RepID=A0A8J3IMY9_9CHLR|nr:transposase [Reticulibacter mediterranei]GHO95353.1 transposase [Reticulibacter mediterranei]
MSQAKDRAHPKKEKKVCEPKDPNLRRKAYKFRLSPTKKQVDKLGWILRRCKEVYNAALEERREAYRMSGVSVSYRMQADQLPAIKRLREEYRDIHSQVLQDVLQRLDKAFQAFFCRVMNGETPGFPRWKNGDRYHSITYPQGGFELLHGNRLHLSKIGHIKIKLHRAMQGKVKTCTIKREGDQWYAILTCEYLRDVATAFHPSDEEVGVKVFAMLSTGEAIENPRHLRVEESKMAAAHRTIHRRKKGSHRRHRAKKELARVSRKVRNRRRDFHHKTSRSLVEQYRVIVFEDLQIKNLTATPKPKQDKETGKYLPNGAAAKAGLSKSILDAGWGNFVRLCASKAEEAGGTVVKVAPHFTTQVCSECGVVAQKDLSVRWHSCPGCGAEFDRDHNAARNILHRYQRNKLIGAGSVPQKPVSLRPEEPIL